MKKNIENTTLDFSDKKRSGFRLHRLEVYNWGTFNGKVRILKPEGDNSLVTGDIGSGKSTLIDAVTTLLVPANRVAYNKAAGAEMKERTLRSYVLGHYKSERNEMGTSAKPVALRDHNGYSVILGVFRNEGFLLDVTVAQVFYWAKDIKGQPDRFYLVGDRDMSISGDFTRFGSNINDLRKRLRGISDVELFDTFPNYGAAFRRRFGIESDQALELFHQTVSMKSVGSLTDFVRQHMLEPFKVEDRITALIHHFDDLTRAHIAVLKAKDQVQRLTPLISDCTRYEDLSEQIADWKECREALKPFFASLKKELLEIRLTRLNDDEVRLVGKIESLSETRSGQLKERDNIKLAIAENGGNRIESIAAEIQQKEEEKAKKQSKSERYADLARRLDIPIANNIDGFIDNRQQVNELLNTCKDTEAELQNHQTEAEFEMRDFRKELASIENELDSLRKRRSNIPESQIAIRRALCSATGIAEEDIPFAGELIQVRPEESEWEGAAERILHNFGLSLLVSDQHYPEVAAWVDKTHLRGKLVYFRVKERPYNDQLTLHEKSLIDKFAIKPDSPFYEWLEEEVSKRFDYACCDTLEEFHRERQAITRTGQMKSGAVRHEKDDRHRIDDRSRYILGWSNEEKIAVLEKQGEEFIKSIHDVTDRIIKAQTEREKLEERKQWLVQIGEYNDFAELDWQPLSVVIEELKKQKKELEAASDILQTLTSKLESLEKTIKETEEKLEKQKGERSQNQLRLEQAGKLLAECVKTIEEFDQEQREKRFPQLEKMQNEVLGERTLQVEFCDNQEREMRDWLQRKIENEDKKLTYLQEKIVKAMEGYRNEYPLETNEVDASVSAAGEYRKMLQQLESDDLPRFETRFKELLNENTIREIANFQSQLTRERQTIDARIEKINESLAQIDYNQGRYILLEPKPNTDADIRDFQQELRACTEGALTGSEDSQYSEAKFLQVKAIVERFRGREGTADLDKKWTRKVTDVRQWFLFSASERWREDDTEFDHYSDSGGKSGGQKEKLAYTVLAASLAYQFGLKWDNAPSRSFRFVVIDEAFGRGSDESAAFGLKLFKKLDLQLLIVTPLQKIHIIEPYVSSVGFVHNEEGKDSQLRNLTIEEYRTEREARKK